MIRSDPSWDKIDSTDDVHCLDDEFEFASSHDSMLSVCQTYLYEFICVYILEVYITSHSRDTRRVICLGICRHSLVRGRPCSAVKVVAPQSSQAMGRTRPIGQ